MINHMIGLQQQSKFKTLYSYQITNKLSNTSSTDRKGVGAVFSAVVAMVAVVTSPQLLDVVWCSCSCSCSVV
jgi:hypothetical protein